MLAKDYLEKIQKIVSVDELMEEYGIDDNFPMLVGADWSLLINLFTNTETLGKWKFKEKPDNGRIRFDYVPGVSVIQVINGLPLDFVTSCDEILKYRLNGEEIQNPVILKHFKKQESYLSSLNFHPYQKINGVFVSSCNKNIEHWKPFIQSLVDVCNGFINKRISFCLPQSYGDNHIHDISEKKLERVIYYP